MAWCPFAVRRPLPENSQQPRTAKRAVILHTAVDAASPNSSIWGYFNRGDVSVESHFYVLDNGTIEQYIDTDIRADANLNANSFAISIETEDDGNPAQNAWTPAQVESIVRLVAWCCDVHGIPKRQIEGPFGSGIGWHSMWGAPSDWTPSAGKTCPGAPRINQSKNVIIPRVAGGQGVDDVTPEDFWLHYKVNGIAMQDYIGGSNRADWETVDLVKALSARVNSIDAKVAGIATPQVQIDYDLLAQKVAALVTASQASANADELKRRLES